MDEGTKKFRREMIELWDGKCAKRGVHKASVKIDEWLHNPQIMLWLQEKLQDMRIQLIETVTGMDDQAKVSKWLDEKATMEEVLEVLKMQTISECSTELGYKKVMHFFRGLFGKATTFDPEQVLKENMSYEKLEKHLAALKDVYAQDIRKLLK